MSRQKFWRELIMNYKVRPGQVYISQLMGSRVYWEVLKVRKHRGVVDCQVKRHEGVEEHRGDVYRLTLTALSYMERVK